MASKESFEDLTQAEIGIKPVEILIKSSSQPVEKPKFNSFIEELAWKNAQRKQNIDTPISQNKEPKIKTDNHAKILEELKQKQKELEDKQKGLEEKKLILILLEKKDGTLLQNWHLLIINLKL